MQYGTSTDNIHCARCRGKWQLPMKYQDDYWWHVHCLQEGQHLLANAERIARVLQPSLFIHEGNAYEVL